MTPRRLAVGVALLVWLVAALGVATADPTASASFASGDDALVLRADADQTIRGEATLPPGSTLIVRIRSTDGTFMVSRTTTVTDDGTFAAAFDLRGVEPPVTVTVAAYRDGTRISDAIRGKVVSPSARVDATRSETGTTTAPGQPGFGVGVALAGIGTGLLARRLA